MPFKCQIFQTRLTFNKNVFVKNCDVRLTIILCIISVILPIIKCAKLENPQIRLLINDDDLLQEKTNIHEASSAADAIQHDNSGEHFNLYRSELKRLSYETIHRILRDENEPSYRREETELRYYQKRSPSYEQNHQLIKRSTKEQALELNLSQQNLTEFLITPQIQKRLNLVSVLDLKNNYISQLNISALSNFTSLSNLNLQNNSLTRIPLGRQTTLRTLNLNNNLIKTSSLSSNVYLRNLYLSGNLIENLSTLQLSLLKNLESLDISHNLLTGSETSFFAERMHNLKHLNLAFNRLGSIYRQTFYNLLSLSTLLLSHNNITDIDYETFLALPNLQFLDLSFNDLQGKSIRALQGITGLVALNIAFNPDIGPYMQEFVASWSLKELDASGTGLCRIPAALAQSVRSLKLTHNWLKVINCGDLDSYPLLQYLDLSFSHIEQIEDDALGRLEILEILMLDHNKLRKVPFSLPVSLEHLFLQNNEIMEIPQQAFLGLSNLKTLDLSRNKLLYLPDIMLPKLQTLNLQSAEIRGISQGIIHSLPKLNDLMLEDNPIKCSDLLGIAEWASTCRLRLEKDGDGEGDAEDNFVTRVQNVKNKFEKMHNFYEQFGLNTSFVNETTLDSLRPPTCAQENLNTLQQMQEKEVQPALNQQSKKTNVNLNSMISSPLVSETTADANKDNTLREEYPTQTFAATTHSSIFNEKQQTFYTTQKSFKSNLNITTNAATIISNTTDYKIKDTTDGKQGKFEITNETKTFDRLNANPNEDAVATTTTYQQMENASIGNAATKSSSNMTGIVEAVSKRTKEAQQQQQLKDKQYKTTLAKSFQTIKSKKWLKQDSPYKGGGKEVAQNLQILLKHRQSDDTDAPQFIKSTTFAMPINSETHATTTATPPSSPTVKSTAAALATTTLVKPFIQFELQNSHHNVKGGREESKEKDVDVVGFERTTSKLQINLENENQQQHEIKTKIVTTKEIKSLTMKTPTKSMQTKTKLTATTLTPTTLQHTIQEATTTEVTIAETALKIPPELTANLDKPNKELNRFNQPTSTISTNNKILTTKSPSMETSTDKTAIEEKHESTATAAIAATAAAVSKTSKTIDQQNITTETTTTLLKDKDLASNYNDSKRQITESINKTSIILTTTTSTVPTISSSSTTTNEYNKIATTFDITATTFALNNTADQQQPNLLQDMMSHDSQFLQKDVIVKCTQSKTDECNSGATTAIQRPDELGTTPTTATEIPKAATSTTTALHKHEPLQLLVKDRHLIGTPLLMHKGENLMVAADELILPTNHHKSEQERKISSSRNSSSSSNNSSSDINDKNRHDLKTNTMANDNKYKPYLETSQSTKLSTAIKTTTATTTAAKATLNSLVKDEHKTNKSTKKKVSENLQPLDSTVRQQDLVKTKKPNYETKTKKPSLIMKKMTFITKQHEDTQHVESVAPLENEVHAKQFDSSHYQELKPLPANLEMQVAQAHMLKHSTINTPINGNNQNNLLKQPHTFQHEHELLIQQILQDQQAETKSEQWSDLRKAESKENHPGLILLVSSGLFVVLLVGLMHVYRCDVPWRRHSSGHHLRPHQRHNQSLEDDSHSFLSYSEGMQKWHHSMRLAAPYLSPLHNLHVRELQKTSATEKAATVKTTATNFKAPPLSQSIALQNGRSLSQSSTTTTSTASASSSAILDDESFYIEMAPDSGQFSQAMHPELLPMELLNMNQSQAQEHQETVGDSHSSMEDECVEHYQQQQRHMPHLAALMPSTSPSASLTRPTSPALLTTCLSVKPKAQSSKFGLW